MNLQSTLTKLAADLDLDAAELIDYANEDTETGWDDGAGAWANGSIWRVDGQVLYALIRATKPKLLLELGTHHGCASTHMLLAMRANDNGASLTSVNNIKGAGNGVPARLRESFKLKQADIYDWLRTKYKSYDFVFVRSSHDSYRVRSIWATRNRLLNPGGFMIHHAAKHHLVGSQVRKGIESADAHPGYYLTEPGDCGLAIWQSDAVDVPLDYDDMKYDALWKLTGPTQRNMRKFIRESVGRNTKPARAKLIALLKSWDESQLEG